MKWLCYVGFGLICFGLGIVFTYLIQGQIVYENIQSFFITGATFGVSGGLALGVVNLFVTLYNKRKEEKEKAIVNLRKHTEALIPILKEWAEKPLTSSEEYLFSLGQQHIMSGYKQLWNTVEGTSGIRKTQSQYENLEKEASQCVRNVLKKQALETSQKIDPDILDDLARAIQNFLERRQSEGKIYTFFAKQSREPSTNTDEYVLQSLRNDGLVKNTYLEGDGKSLLKLAEIMNNLLSDSHLQEMTKSLRTLASQLHESRNAFRERINLIINEINYAVKEEDKILAGKCEKCKAVKDKWHIR